MFTKEQVEQALTEKLVAQYEEIITLVREKYAQFKDKGLEVGVDLFASGMWHITVDWGRKSGHCLLDAVGKGIDLIPGYLERLREREWEKPEEPLEPFKHTYFVTRRDKLLRQKAMVEAVSAEAARKEALTLYSWDDDDRVEVFLGHWQEIERWKE